MPGVAIVCLIFLALLGGTAIIASVSELLKPRY